MLWRFDGDLSNVKMMSFFNGNCAEILRLLDDYFWLPVALFLVEQFNLMLDHRSLQRPVGQNMSIEACQQFGFGCMHIAFKNVVRRCCCDDKKDVYGMCFVVDLYFYSELWF